MMKVEPIYLVRNLLAAVLYRSSRRFLVLFSTIHT
jgi:hypothetical protein